MDKLQWQMQIREREKKQTKGVLKSATLMLPMEWFSTKVTNYPFMPFETEPGDVVDRGGKISAVPSRSTTKDEEHCS